MQTKRPLGFLVMVLVTGGRFITLHSWLCDDPNDTRSTNDSSNAHKDVSCSGSCFVSFFPFVFVGLR